MSHAEARYRAWVQFQHDHPELGGRMGEHIEPDPRTDGVGDGGMGELDPPTEEDIARGIEHDRQLRQRQIEDPETPYREDPADDEYDR